MPIKDFSYPTPAYQGLVLEQSKYNIDPYNFELLGKALDKQEARHNAAIQQKSKVDEALGKIRERLYEHPENMQWFDAYNQNIENSISELVATGDYAGALAEATRIGGEAAKDKEVIARIKYSDELKEHEKIIQAMYNDGKIDDDYLAYDRKFNGWNFKPIYKKDGDGNNTKDIIGYEHYKPEQSINGMPDYTNITALAFKMITAKQGGYDNVEAVTDEKGGIVTKTVGGKTMFTYKNKSSNTLFYVSEDEIRNNIKDILKNQSGVRNQLFTDYKVKKEALIDLKKRLDKNDLSDEERKDLSNEYNERIKEFEVYDYVKGVPVLRKSSTLENDNYDANVLFENFLYNKIYNNMVKTLAKHNVKSEDQERLVGANEDDGNGTGNGGNGTGSPGHTNVNTQGNDQVKTSK